jgi:hypothetical protein
LAFSSQVYPEQEMAGKGSRFKGMHAAQITEAATTLLG